MSKRRKECGKGEGGNVIGNKCMSQKSEENFKGCSATSYEAEGSWLFTEKA